MESGRRGRRGSVDSFVAPCNGLTPTFSGQLQRAPPPLELATPLPTQVHALPAHCVLDGRRQA